MTGLFLFVLTQFSLQQNISSTVGHSVAIIAVNCHASSDLDLLFSFLCFLLQYCPIDKYLLLSHFICLSYRSISTLPGTRKLEYGGSTWHEGCFICHSCEQPIGSKSFIPDKDEHYCVSCYEDKFTPRCTRCKKVSVEIFPKFPLFIRQNYIPAYSLFPDSGNQSG